MKAQYRNMPLGPYEERTREPAIAIADELEQVFRITIARLPHAYRY